MKHAGRTVLVTGARRGVGLLLTRHFADQGARVIGFSRHDGVEDDAKTLPEGCTMLAVDVADEAAVARAFEAIRRDFGGVDIVVNNAAVLTSQYAMILSPGAARSMLETNVLGTFLVSRAAARLMLKKRWGRIINIGSMAASLEPQGDSVYAATKAAVATLANVMAKEFAPFGVTCNTLGISAIATDMLGQLPADKVAAVVASLPLPRQATPQDIFNVVDFFASEASAYITAQTIYLGGVH